MLFLEKSANKIGNSLKTDFDKGKDLSGKPPSTIYGISNSLKTLAYVLSSSELATVTVISAKEIFRFLTTLIISLPISLASVTSPGAEIILSSCSFSFFTCCFLAFSS